MTKAEKTCAKESEIEVLKHDFSFMGEQLKELKELQRDGQKEIVAKIDSVVKTFSDSLHVYKRESDDKYATKVDHSHNLERITKIESSLNKIVWILVTAILAATLKLVLI